jgi:DNA-binding NarL/FixJ family response regulator
VTVRNHVRDVLQKLGVHTKFAAVVFAYQNEILQPAGHLIRRAL